MKITMTMDAFGRLVLPKRVRERLRLRPGARLNIADFLAIRSPGDPEIVHPGGARA